MLADLEARLISDQLSVLANIGKTISVNRNISKISYRCITIDHNNIMIGVELRVTDNTIPAGGKKNIRIKIRPCIRGQHTIKLKYQLDIPIIGKEILHHHELSIIIIDQSTVGEQSLCSVVFNAVYPSLSVTSVLGDGSLSHLSKSRLWNMLYIDKLVVSMVT